MEINFELQYNDCYKTRMRILKKLILQSNFIKEYGYPVKMLDDCLNDECIVIATLFLESNTKYSILNEKSSIENPGNINVKSYFTNDSVLYIEDEIGRIKIRFCDGFHKLKAYVTGMVCGFVGKVENNVFECTDVIFPVSADETDIVRQGKVLLMSNVLINAENINWVKMVTDIFSKKIDEIIIVGDILDLNDKTNNEKSIDDVNYGKLFEEIQRKITIIPGIGDCTTFLLPQLPFPTKFFKNSNQDNLQLASNPCKIDFNGNKLVILSHHIINDIARYVLDSDENFSVTDQLRMEILKQLVKIRYLVPNAPDTIGCIPYKNEDPFILNEFNLLITGGCDSSIMVNFKNKILLGVPDFNSTRKALLFDFDHLDFEEIELSI